MLRTWWMACPLQTPISWRGLTRTSNGLKILMVRRLSKTHYILLSFNINVNVLLFFHRCMLNESALWFEESWKVCERVGQCFRKCLTHNTLVTDEREMSNRKFWMSVSLIAMTPFLFLPWMEKCKYKRDCDVDTDECTWKGSFKMELFYLFFLFLFFLESTFSWYWPLAWF